MSANTDVPAAEIPYQTKYNPWLIAVTVTMATFMEVLDTSIANVALPHMAGSLSVSTEESTWVLTSYLVSNAIILPLSGWLSSVLGRKRFYMISVFIFTIASALCGFATSIEQLVFFRVLQGLGGGGLQPSEQAILMDTFRSEGWRWPSTASRSSAPRFWGRRSAVSSPITIRGDGSSISTCRWGFSR
jgi:DHA2 family multidrug resistance protein